MCLQTKSPARVLQTIVQCHAGVRFPRRSVHRLKEEVLEIEFLVHFRTCANLRENEFQFVPRAKFEFRMCFWAHTYPINVRTCGLGPICFDGYLEPDSVESIDQRLIQLEEGFTSSANNEGP